MVTDISAADLRSWSGAGPLPRARSISSGSGSAAKMTHVVESAVRVEPWEVGYATVAVHRTPCGCSDFVNVFCLTTTNSSKLRYACCALGVVRRYFPRWCCGSLFGILIFIFKSRVLCRYA